MFVVKKTGLVPVVSIRGGRSGVYGVPPAVARKGVADGTLSLFTDIPDDIETIEVAGPAETAPEPKKVDDVELIDIPDDWAERHHLFRMSLAKKISGADVPKATDEQKEAGTTTVDLADAIIAAEIQRRAAADSPTE